MSQTYAFKSTSKSNVTKLYMLLRGLGVYGSLCATLLTHLSCASRSFQNDPPRQDDASDAQAFWRRSAPQNTRSSGLGAPGEYEVLSDAEAQKFLDLYKIDASLKAKLFAQKLPAHLQAEIGVPVPPFFNTHILWVASGNPLQRLKGYRPVITTTGCDSGCAPVAFHLEFNPEGQVQALLEHPQYPLTKLYHQPMTAADKQQLLSVAQQLPQAFRYVGEPKWLTNHNESFPYQTWTVFQKAVVTGAAYTSFRVYEAALGVSELLSQNRDKVLQRQSQIKNISSWSKELGEAQGNRRFEVFQKGNLFLQDPNTLPEVKFFIAQIMLRQFENWSQSQELTGAYVSSLGAQKIFEEHFRGFSCDLLKIAFENQKTRREIFVPLAQLPAAKRQVGYLSCGAGADALLPLLALHLDGLPLPVTEHSHVPKDLSGMRSLLQSPAYLLALGDLQKRLQWAQASDATFGTFFARFPLYAERVQRNPFSIAIPQRSQIQDAENQALEQLGNELGRSIVTPAQPMVPLQATQRGQSVDLSQIKKRIWVFFAPWCPHCRSTVISWVKSAPKKFWENVSLIQIYEKGDARETDEFCSVTGLKDLDPNLCADIIKVPQVPANLKGFSALGIQGVPKIMVASPQGQIAVADFSLPQSPYADSAKQLLLLLRNVQKQWETHP